MPVVAMPSAMALDLRSVLDVARAAQSRWAAVPVRERLASIRRLRHLIARHAEALAATVPLSVPGSLQRNLADTLVAEVLPLADACRFLERNAESILAPRKLSRRGRPFYFRQVAAAVERVPYGVVLILGPANYPLFLPGVQAIQALAAGNAVLWKPAPTGADAAKLLLTLFRDAGLPPGLVTTLDTDVASGQAAVASGIDKVILTGHVATGRAVLRSLSDAVTPAVMELSGCDAVFILPGADLDHAVRAIAFGMRLNGSATCMAPRRLFVSASIAEQFEFLLREALQGLPPVPLTSAIAREMQALIDDAKRAGARLTYDESGADDARPTLICDAGPEMRAMQTDIFAPLLSMIAFSTEADAIAAHRACPYALTASVFGPERDARRLAGQLGVGTVLINDIVVPTADPRLPFSGRGKSGFGVTRGAEGLLEMTAIRTVAVQKHADARAYETTTGAHVPFFTAYIRTAHSRTWTERVHAMRTLVIAARSLPRRLRSGPRSHKET